MLIGITGPSGAGKTLVSSFLKKEGYFVVDADEVSRKVMKKGSPALKEVEEAFGKEFFKDGELDRKKLGELVFSDEEKLKILTKISHKYIIEEIKAELKGKEGVKILDAPLLFDTPLEALCNKILLITAPEEERIARIIKRDSISEEHAKNRVASQMKNKDYTKRADCAIINDKGKDWLLEEAKKIISWWVKAVEIL